MSSLSKLMRRFSICINKNLRQFKFKLLSFAYRFVVSNCKKMIAIFHMCHIMSIFCATQMLYGSCQVIIDQTAIFGIDLEGTFYLNMIIILYSDLQIFIPLTSLDNHYDAILLIGELSKVIRSNLVSLTSKVACMYIAIFQFYMLKSGNSILVRQKC